MDLASFFNQTIELVIAGEWASVAVAVVFISIAQIRKVVDAFDYIRDRKIRSISSLLDIGGISEETKYVLMQSIEQIAFLRATGISTDEIGRNKITGILQASEGGISVLSLRRINAYVRHVDGQVTIPLSAIDYFELIWNIFTLALVLILLVLMGISFYQIPEITWQVSVVWGCLFTFGFFLALLPLRTILLFIKAKEVKEYFATFEQKENDQEKQGRS